MRRFSGHIIGVDQGQLVLFSDFEDGGEMWTGEGPRLLRREIRFSTRFRDAPVVQASLAMWDMDTRQNIRADLTTEAISAEGFELVFRTWGDTRVARVRAAWLAIGEMPSDQDWAVD